MDSKHESSGDGTTRFLGSGHRSTFGVQAFKTLIADRRKTAAAIAGAAVLIGTASVATFDSRIGQGARAGAESFLALVGARSPGDRAGDELTKIKSRVLSDSLPLESHDVPSALPLAAVNSVPKPTNAIALVSPASQMPLVPIPAFGFGGPGWAPPPSGGGSPPSGCCTGGYPPGGGGTPPPVGPPPPGPSPGVPEPATWAMMLLGFAGMGLTLRRRGSQLQRA